MLPEYLVCEFAKETLSNLVRERFGSEFPDIVRKPQIEYIFNYLNDLKCKTILMESDYIDRDYLEDYSRYYVKCFDDYGERCSRLHFFNLDFDHEKFGHFFDDEECISAHDFKTSYLGFMVIKPLPKTFIGKSCLKVYPAIESSKNKFVLARPYQVSLFGISLTVESVAFQEQEKVVSACATTAIWMALHAVQNSDFVHIPSISEITLSAINHISDSSNSFPNKGLSNKQILRALDVQKFRNHKINVDPNTNKGKDAFFEIVKSYIKSDIPLILGGNVYDFDESSSEISINHDENGHAVTIVGFKDDNALYIHDDRVGPFARCQIKSLNSQNQTEEPSNSSNENWGIFVQDKNPDGTWRIAFQIIVPNSLIVPVYEKIRISSDFIHNTCKSLLAEYNAYYKEYLDSGELSDEDFVELFYDVHIESCAKYKQDIIQAPNILNKREVLLKSTSKHLWIASFRKEQDNSLFEIIFDSTDIPQGNGTIGTAIYDDAAYSAFTLPLQNLLKYHTSIDPVPRDFFSSYIRSLRVLPEDYYGYLSRQYGEPRAPKRINREEIVENHLHDQEPIRLYGNSEKRIFEILEELNAQHSEYPKIWVITADGALCLGNEIGRKGHPTLTGFKSARIAGEITIDEQSRIVINAKSGRYSSNYPNADELLENARRRFLEIFSDLKKDMIRVEVYASS